MNTLKSTFLSLFLVAASCTGTWAQGGDSAPQAPYSTDYFNRLSQLQESFRWVYEQPAPVADTADAWLKWQTVDNFTFGKDRGNLPMIADVQSLHPYFRDKVIELIYQCKQKGIELAIVETYRTHAKQNEYKSMGKKYTRSGGGHSRHQYGLAIDVVPIIDSVAQWDNTALWKKVGVIGERLGLRWGGRWRNPYDPGHFEWTAGLTSHHLVQGMFPPVPRKDQNDYPCIEEDLKHLMRYWNEWETEQSAMVRQTKETTTTGKTAMK